MSKIILEKTLVQGIVDYLQRKPWSDVDHLLQGLQNCPAIPDKDYQIMVKALQDAQRNENPA